MKTPGTLQGEGFGRLLQKQRPLYRLRNSWGIDGFSQEATIEHLEKLIDFCKRAEAKKVNIAVWT